MTHNWWLDASVTFLSSHFALIDVVRCEPPNNKSICTYSNRKCIFKNYSYNHLVYFSDQHVVNVRVEGSFLLLYIVQYIVYWKMYDVSPLWDDVVLEALLEQLIILFAGCKAGIFFCCQVMNSVRVQLEKERNRKREKKRAALVLNFDGSCLLFAL